MSMVPIGEATADRILEVVHERPGIIVKELAAAVYLSTGGTRDQLRHPRMKDRILYLKGPGRQYYVFPAEHAPPPCWFSRPDAEKQIANGCHSCPFQVKCIPQGVDFVIEGVDFAYCKNPKCGRRHNKRDPRGDLSKFCSIACYNTVNTRK